MEGATSDLVDLMFGKWEACGYERLMVDVIDWAEENMDTYFTKGLLNRMANLPGDAIQLGLHFYDIFFGGKECYTAEQ